MKKQIEGLLSQLEAKDYSPYSLKRMLRITEQSIQRLEREYPLLNHPLFITLSV